MRWPFNFSGTFDLNATGFISVAIRLSYKKVRDYLIIQKV